MNNSNLLIVYQKSDGSLPFTDWLNVLADPATRAKIRTRINRLRLGNMGDCRFLGNGIYELRIHFGPGFRVYLGKEGDLIIILLCGGDKSTQKRDIEKAKQYWEDYKTQSNESPSFC